MSDTASTKKHAPKRSWLRWLGGLLVLISLIFVVQRIFATKVWALEGIEPGRLLAALGAGSVVYAGANFLLSGGWTTLLGIFGGAIPSRRVMHGIYARTQIARYLPGNIFHLASRHVAGHGAGVGHGALAGAAVAELAGVLVASVAVALVGAPTLLKGTSNFLGDELRTGLVLMGAALFIGPLVIGFALARGPWRERVPEALRSPTGLGKTTAPVLVRYIVFFLITGAIVIMLGATIGGARDGAVAPALLTIYAASWTAGFITPGAPAGAGVREAAMVALLTPIIGEEAGLIVAVGLRVVTTLGDTLFFAMSFALPRPVSVDA